MNRAASLARSHHNKTRLPLQISLTEYCKENISDSPISFMPESVLYFVTTYLISFTFRMIL